MWTPKSPDFEVLANEIAKLYTTDPVMSVEEIAEFFQLSIPSVYRYLKYKNVPIRPRNRDKNGRFSKST